MKICAEQKSKHSATIYFHFKLENSSFVSGQAAIIQLLPIRHSAEANNRALFCFSSTNSSKQTNMARLHDERVIFKNQKKESDAWFAVCNVFQMQMSVCVAMLTYQISDAAWL